MYELTRLESGLTIATAAMPHMASVSLGLWVGVGGRYEPAELNGVSHFIEHMLFKGTRRRSARQISQAVEGIGGYLNAFTGEESTCFQAKARYDHFDDLLDVLVDMFLNSTFAAPEIEKERAVIKEELAMYLDQPQQYVHELLNETLWPDHPLGRSLTGSEATIDAMRRADLLSFRRSHYVSAASLFAAAGNLTHAQVVKAVAPAAGRFPRSPRPTCLPVQVAQRRPVIRLHTKSIEQTQMALGIRTCSRHDDRRFALRLLNTVLGENMSSRLFQTVREESGLAYSIYSAPSFYDDAGTLTISAGLDTAHLPRVLKLIIRELRRLAGTPLSPTEMRRARDYVLGQIDLSLENTENQMMWLGEQYLGYGRITSAARIKQRLHRVTRSDIRRAAQDFFRSEGMNLAIVSPLKTTRGLLKALEI